MHVAPGRVGKLKARYGKALKTVKLEDGEKVIWLKGTLGGCKVFTDFGEAGRPNSAPLIMILMGTRAATTAERGVVRTAAGFPPPRPARP